MNTRKEQVKIMTRIDFKVTGTPLEEYAKRYKASNIKKKLAQLMKEALAEGYEEARKLCPVDTGYMFGQIYARLLNERTAIIGCDCKYAEPNEFGWYAIPAIGTMKKPNLYKSGYRPFLRPGIWRMMEELKNKMHLIFEEE